VKCSFLELYNETMYDLLQDGEVQVGIPATSENINCKEFDVTSYNECLKLLWRGWDKRKVAETAMNRESSRSHAIFLLNLETEHTVDDVTNNRKSRLNLVDLAGSERQSHAQNTGDRLREAGKINQSLSTLARVIRTLANNPRQKKYISYRDSKLTLLLRDSLGGNARTCVVVNIHPNRQFVGETISTMQFAENVKKVRNITTVNEEISCENIESWKDEIKRLREQVREFEAELANKSETAAKIDRLENENGKLQSQISALNRRLQESQKSADEKKNQAFQLLPAVRKLFEQQTESSKKCLEETAPARRTDDRPKKVHIDAEPDVQILKGASEC
jgi:predicted transcriptional regulator